MSLQPTTYNLQPIKCGFTLIELLVASAIFTVVSVVAVGAILTINDANRKAQAIRAVVDNLNFTMESMSRQLITGSYYHCDALDVLSSSFTSVAEKLCPNPAEGADSIAFLSSGDLLGGLAGQVIVYSREVDAVGKGKIVAYQMQNSRIVPLTMTPPEIDIQAMRFFVRTQGKPSVTMTVKGQILLKRDNLTTDFNLQTTVAQLLR